MRSNESVIGSSDCQALGAPKRASQETPKPADKPMGNGVIQGADGRFRTDRPTPIGDWTKVFPHESANAQKSVMVGVDAAEGQRHYQSQMRPDGRLVMVETDADGWVEWMAGTQPVPDAVVVQVRTIIGDKSQASLRADAWRWAYIEAYRVVQQPAEQQVEFDRACIECDAGVQAGADALPPGTSYATLAAGEFWYC